MQNILTTGFMTPMMFGMSLYLIIRTSPGLGIYVCWRCRYYYWQLSISKIFGTIVNEAQKEPR